MLTGLAYHVGSREREESGEPIYMASAMTRPQQTKNVSVPSDPTPSPPTLAVFASDLSQPTSVWVLCVERYPARTPLRFSARLFAWPSVSSPAYWLVGV